MPSPSLEPPDGAAAWFAEELARSDAAASALKRALPKALQIAKAGRTPISVELYDPIRHHGLEQRELIQVRAGSALARALWPGLFLGSMLSALAGWTVVTRFGRPQLWWQPSLAQLIAIICGQVWAMRLRERIPVEALGLSGTQRELGGGGLHAWLHASRDLWQLIRASIDKHLFIAERVLYHGAPISALLGATGWAWNLVRPGTSAGTGPLQVGFLAVEVGLFLWLAFLSTAVLLLDFTENTVGANNATTLRGQSRGVSLSSVLWPTCCVLLGLALLGFAVRGTPTSQRGSPTLHPPPQVVPSTVPPSAPAPTLDQARFGVVGYGYDKPVGDKMPGGGEKNRRTNVVLMKACPRSPSACLLRPRANDAMTSPCIVRIA